MAGYAFSIAGLFSYSETANETTTEGKLANSRKLLPTRRERSDHHRPNNIVAGVLYDLRSHAPQYFYRALCISLPRGSFCHLFLQCFPTGGEITTTSLSSI